MKKTLSILLVLCLMVSMFVTTSYALIPLSSEFTSFAFSANATTTGSLAIDGAGAITLTAPNGAWWPSIGISTNKTVQIDGLNVKFNATVGADASPNCFASVMLSKQQPTSMDLFDGGRGYGPLAADGLAFTLYGTGADQKLWIVANGTVVDVLDVDNDGVIDTDNSDTNCETVAADVDNVLRFDVQNGELVAYVNDVILTYQDSTPYDFTGVFNCFNNGRAYLTVAANGYGGAGRAITLKQINGVAANEFISLSSEFTSFDFSANASTTGNLTVNNAGNILLTAPNGLWWPSVGVSTNKTVALDGLNVMFNATVGADVSPNCFASIMLSKQKPTSMDLFDGGRGYGPLAADAIAFTLYGTGADQKLWIVANGTVVDVLDVDDDGTIDTDNTDTNCETVAANVDNVLRFAVEDGELVAYVNDVILTYQDSTPYDFTGVLGCFDGGRAYLTVAANGYGGAGRAITLKEINEIAANEFVSLSAGWTTNADGTNVISSVNADGSLGLQGVGGSKHQNFYYQDLIKMAGLTLEVDLISTMHSVAPGENTNMGPVIFLSADPNKGMVDDINGFAGGGYDGQNGLAIAFGWDATTAQYRLSVISIYNGSVTPYTFYKNDLTLCNNETMTLEIIQHEDGFYYLYVDDEVLLAFDDSQYPYLSAGMGDMAPFNNGQAYLSISNGTYGGAVNSIILRTINGVAANDYVTANVTLDKATSTLVEGATDTLTATVTPANASDDTVIWYSSDDAIATVVDGVVTAVAAGTATITVETADGNKATCAVTVTKSVTGVTLDQDALDLEIGDTATLVATIAPEDATNLLVTWTSSDDAIATVVDGVVTAVAAGTATITVTTADGSFTDTCTVTVTAAEVPDTADGIYVVIAMLMLSLAAAVVVFKAKKA